MKNETLIELKRTLSIVVERDNLAANINYWNNEKGRYKDFKYVLITLAVLVAILFIVYPSNDWNFWDFIGSLTYLLLLIIYPVLGFMFVKKIIKKEVYLSTKEKINEKQIEIDEMLYELFDKMSNVDNKLKTSKIPSAFHTQRSINFIVQCLEDRGAENLPEAIRMYEEWERHNALMNEYKTIQHNQYILKMQNQQIMDENKKLSNKIGKLNRKIKWNK